MNVIQLQNVCIDQVQTGPGNKNLVTVDVLRLDRLHPLVSGNKWFKLKEYLRQAQLQHKKTILTFGGAFSNHILATAAACHELHLQSVGIIRGEESHPLSLTLQEAKALGMELVFISRTAYKTKELSIDILEKYSDAYLIPEGGYGREGMMGAQDILTTWNDASYTHIVAAVGTGTTLAGLITAALPHQKIVGISVLKNNFSLEDEVRQLTGSSGGSFEINHTYHFGGYAKHTPLLFQFMNAWYQKTGIPTDFVYTGKLFFAIQDLIQSGYFPAGSRLLIIHSGGLQGNQSLPAGTLMY